MFAGKLAYGAACSALSLGIAALVSGSHFAVMTDAFLAEEVIVL